MKIDLHIHSKNGSDGKWPLEQIFPEAKRRGISLISITDHDSLQGQEEARRLAKIQGIKYLTGVELNVTFTHSHYTKGKAASLDFLGYAFDIRNKALIDKLHALRSYRRQRAQKILENINEEFLKEGRALFTTKDMDAIEAGVDGSFGRPHIANYLIGKGDRGHQAGGIRPVSYPVRCTQDAVVTSRGIRLDQRRRGKTCACPPQ